MLVGKALDVYGGIAVVVVFVELKEIGLSGPGHQYLCVSVNTQLSARFTMAIVVPRIITAKPKAVRSHNNTYLRLMNPLFFSFM